MTENSTWIKNINEKVRVYAMTWRGFNEAEDYLIANVCQWMQIAREAYKERNPNWLPDTADFFKSALLERLMQGKAPLEFPPPVSLSCPHYALVEDAGPHNIGSSDWLKFREQCLAFERLDRLDMLFKSIDPFRENLWDSNLLEKYPEDYDVCVDIMQSAYRIIGRCDNKFLIEDSHHVPQTPYKFVLWYDANYGLKTNTIRNFTGTWFLQNLDFHAPIIFQIKSDVISSR